MQRRLQAHWLARPLGQGASLCAVEERGWGWPASETRQAQLQKLNGLGLDLS